MKHASPQTLEQLQDLIDQISGMPGLKRRSPGVFYRGTKAFLHFHEDPAGIFADLKRGPDFVRYPVNNAAERALLMREIAMLIKD